MGGLEAAVGEVGCQLELTLEGRRAGLFETTALNLEREADEVLAADDDELLQLCELR